MNLFGGSSTLYSSKWESLKRNLQCELRCNLLRLLPEFCHPDSRQWRALEIHEELNRQAFIGTHPSFEVPFESAVLRGGVRRERLDSSHHYGHDVVLKRHAGMALIGRPLPLMLEHGLKVSTGAIFEPPRYWMRGFVCMGPYRAEQLKKRYRLPAIVIGPWISYARPLMNSSDLEELRAQLGSTLLVVLAHSWEFVERRCSLEACIDAVQKLQHSGGYRTVIWLRHWMDAPIQLPATWITACNGHRSNPWFLDSLRTLLELSDGMASNALGTHLGYGIALGKRLHWIDVEAEQDLSRLTKEKARMEDQEWQARRRLIEELRVRLDQEHGAAAAELWELFQSHWGLGQRLEPGEMAAMLTNPAFLLGR